VNIKLRYFEDIQLFKNNVARIWFTILLINLGIFPLLVSNYHIYLVNYIAVNIIVAIGLNILVGYTGQISLGHAGFFGIGAYATVLIMMHFNLPFFIALIIAAFLAAGFGFILGLPALRLEGPYLAIATLGFGMAITQILGRWPIFGGHMGLQAPRLQLGPWLIETDYELYFIIIPLTVILSIAAINITKTRIGRAFIAIRESDIAAEAMGVNITYYKTLAFALRAFYTGLAGGLMAFVIGFINPNSFNFILSILFLAMVVVGGLGSILGSIMGAIVVSFLYLKLEAIQYIPYIGDLLVTISKNWMSLSGLPNVSSVIFGFILIMIVVIEPLGLYGFWIRIKKYWKTWPF
jgi:branched-chain amino acid transport system permease protein